MEWWDEEGEILPDYVDEYYFIDQNDVLVNFSLLPLKWLNEDADVSLGLTVFLRGNIDSQDHSFCKLAKAWKFDFSDTHLKIEVLLHGRHWITLQRPSKIYETFIRTTLVTLLFLHFAKRNPEATSYDVLNSLHQVDGIQPSEDDLLDHFSLIREAMKRDEDLTKSKCLLTFLEKTSPTTPIEVELPTNQHQDAQTLEEENFTVDNMMGEENSSDDDSETDLQFDPVCSICDNGGYVLCCEGSCLRSFHPTIADGIETECESLGFTDDTQVHALGNYLCNNCHYKQHQCYACGQLGSSDENSSQEVFPCSASNCGHFYHPICVARLLYVDDQIKSEELQAKIAARDAFCCPLHICKVCNSSENKNLYALHFAVCRRCPTAYHRKCLPSDITSELNCDEERPQRAWERLLPYNRILIYCLAHEIEGHISTPARAALKMFEEGRDEAAKALFDPNILLQLMKHKKKLEIYLSPFLHGMRYTSFGRHFTKHEKLKEIVERLHYYVENGDTVVDFCCGSNDFSCMMKEKLAQTGKTCFFKNFDLIAPKKNFNFEMRDWLSVKAEELAVGSQLIMGLNPPFGHKASLANVFIRKALEFKPKILILIVPSETKRVDEIADYELIWEDTKLLSGMSFYLPGSIDVNDKTIEQWNNIPPPLYLWSRKDWSGSHKIRALQQGHITQIHHSTYNEDFHHAEIRHGDNGMEKDMDLSI